MTSKQYQSYNSQTIRFYLSQPEEHLYCSASTNVTFNSITKGKLGFILNLIHKYQPSSSFIHQNSILSSTLPQNQQKPQQRNFIPQLSSIPQNSSFYQNDHQQDLLISPLKESGQLCDSAIYQLKHGDFKISQFKSQLEQTHQKILHKYLTPIRDTQPSSNSTNSNNTEIQDTICEFMNSSNQKRDDFNHKKETQEDFNYKDENTNNSQTYQEYQNLNNKKLELNNQILPDKNTVEYTPQKVDEMSFPLVESVMMADIKDQLRQYSSFLSKQMLKIMDQELVNKEQQTDELKLRHIFAFCAIILLLLLWKM